MKTSAYVFFVCCVYLFNVITAESDENDRWTFCNNFRCDETCQNRRTLISYLPHLCNPSCSCKNDLVWDKQQNKCVREEGCSELCGKYEEWQQCSNVKCRETCQKPTRPEICTLVCVPGCSTKEGFLWDENLKKSVPRLDCSNVCGENQEWCKNIPDNIATCQSILRPQCNNFIGSLYTPRSGCICKAGYMWDKSSQKCLLLKDCPGFPTSTGL